MAKKVLVADDSLTIQKVIELTFSEENYQVIAYSNGRDALNHIKDECPDMLLADAVMPELDGYALCAQAKALHPDLPVILLSGTFEHFDRDKAEAAHYDEVVMKPFDSQGLIRKVEALIRRVPPVPAAPPTAEISAPPTAPDVQPFAPSLFDGPHAPDPGLFSPPPDLFVRDLPGASQPPHYEPPPESMLEETVPPFEEVPMSGTGYTPPTAAVPPVEFDLFSTPALFPEPEKKFAPPMPAPFVEEPLFLGPVKTTPTPIPESVPTMPPVFEEMESAPPFESVFAPPPKPPAPPLPVMDIPADFAEPAASPFDMAPPLMAQPKSVPEVPAPVSGTSAPVPPPAPAAFEKGHITAPVVVELSTTQMTAVVKAVVGQISDGVVRQIAWEVVPELAELMIRQRIKDIEEKEG